MVCLLEMGNYSGTFWKSLKTLDIHMVISAKKKIELEKKKCL